MVIATFLGGIFMILVHSVASKMEDTEYSLFVSLLGFFIMLGVPAAGLQTVFAQKSAAAIDEQRQRDLRAMMRSVLKGTFIFWLISGVVIVAATAPLSALLKIRNPAALWLTVVLALPTLWLPIARGLLQGRHHFAGMGWLQILDGIGRFAAMAVIVLILHGQAAGGLLAALIGNIGAIAIAAWLTRDIWRSKEIGRFDWKPWLAQVVPLTLGAGAIILMSSIDRVFVQSLFADTKLNQLYGGATLTGFAIIQFIAPITVVMFPKIVRSTARAEKSNALALTVLVTGIFGAAAAIGCTIFPELPLRVIYSRTPEIWKAKYLVPWFAWGLLPLTLANVLIQDLLARGRFKAAFWLILVPIIYAGTLIAVSPALIKMPQLLAFTRVAQILGLSCLLLFCVAGWFSFRDGKISPAPLDREQEAARSASDKSCFPPDEAPRAKS